MRKFVAVAAMLAAMGGVASAQGGAAGAGRAQVTPEQRLAGMMSRLFSGIILNDSQKAKATEIIKKSMSESMGIDRKTPEGMEKSQSITKSRNDELRELLKSDEDKKKFDENAAMGRGRGRSGS